MLSSTFTANIPVDKAFSPSYHHFKERYNLEGLVQDVKKHLGESGGISSEDVDEDYLISLLRKYISDPSDWIDYFYNDTSKNYTRNAIENINHKANIVRRHFTKDILYGAHANLALASSSLEPGQGISYPRPCQCSLHHESFGRPIT